MIIYKAQTGDDSDNEEPPANNGTLIVDATCAPSQIKYPQDTELLNEARKNTESMIDSLHKPTDGKSLVRTAKRRISIIFPLLVRRKRTKRKYERQSKNSFHTLSVISVLLNLIKQKEDC